MSDNAPYAAFSFQYPHPIKYLVTDVTVYGVSTDLVLNKITVRALWDTGASHSLITPELSKKLGLVPVDTAHVTGVNSTGTASIALITIELPNGITLSQKRVAVCTLTKDIDVLIGLDILLMGDLSICNADNNALFSFVMPSLPSKINLAELAANENAGRKQVQS
jgi:hypothetical protein